MSEVARGGMGSLPRILTIMGSGETAPTMVKVHRSVLARMGPPPVPAVLLDTPFGFQENATELAQRVVHYFAESLRAGIEVASASAGELEGSSRPIDSGDDPFASERTVAKVRSANYVFAGPGSPSYALRNWAGTVIPSLLKEKLTHGGAVTFSSAAALTLGVSTVPVYEIYKVGADPFWLDGLDVLGVTGLSAAVIPHYNNAEGGTHDTRFCYLGERRLSQIEPDLPEGAFVLGIDEHTAIILDLDTRTAEIQGNGLVTIRAAGRSRTWAAGEWVCFDEIAGTAEALRRGRPGGAEPEAGHARHPAGANAATTVPGAAGNPEDAAIGDYHASPLLDAVREQEDAFAKALAARDMAGAVGALLRLEEEITAWSHDIPSGDAMDRARASLRSLVLELGQSGERGVRDPREVIGPFVDTMLDMRREARADKRYADADAIRDRLSALGVEVRDTPEGSDWVVGTGTRW